MIKIDARGRSCPEPVIMTKNQLESNPNANFEVLVDTNVAVENITRFIQSKDYNLNILKLQDEYKLTITRSTNG